MSDTDFYNQPTIRFYNNFRGIESGETIRAIS